MPPQVAEADIMKRPPRNAATLGSASDVFGDMWRRDWLAFADLFYAERAAARRRLVDGHGPVDVSNIAPHLYSPRFAAPGGPAVAEL